LQHALGHANDATTAQPFLSTLARDHVTPEIHRAIGAVVGWQARDRTETREDAAQTLAPLQGYADFPGQLEVTIDLRGSSYLQASPDGNRSKNFDRQGRQFVDRRR
jgi:hypothetical protein